LITLGAWDNEQVAKPLNFLDRITASRRIFVKHFPGGKAQYDEAKQKTGFKKALQATWGLERGQAGKWRDIVRVDDSTWNLFISIISGTYIFAKAAHILFFVGIILKLVQVKKQK
jgi:hypothetical protein